MRLTLILTSLLVSSIVKIHSNPVEHIIFIGIDGFSSCSLDKVDLPTIESMMKSGSYTLTKRCVMPSSSAPNWASMFMGVPTEIHGYTQWGSTHPEIDPPFEQKNNILPTFFQLARDSRPDFEIGYIYEWEGMRHLADTLSMDYHEEAVDYLENKDLLTDIACDYIKRKKPNLLGIIFASPDDMGHKHGFESNEYYNELASVDRKINRIIKCVDDAGFLENTVFVITSDHGGMGYDHGGITLSEMKTPLIVVGCGIKKDNPIDEFMMQYDVASVVLDIFEIEQPEYWRGRSVDIKDDANEGMTVERITPALSVGTATRYFDLQGRSYTYKIPKQIMIKTTVDPDGIITGTKHIETY